MTPGKLILVCGTVLLLAGIGYMATGNEGGSGWLMVIGGAGSLIGGLLMMRSGKRSAGGGR